MKSLLWLVPAIITLFLTGGFNSYCQYIGIKFSKTTHEKIIFCNLFFVVMGIIGLFILLFYKFIKPKTLDNLNQKLKQPFIKAMIPGILLCIIMVLNIMALSGGGSIAMVVINLNMLVTLYLGSLFLGDKFNNKIIISTLIALVFISYSVYEFMIINEKK